MQNFVINLDILAQGFKSGISGPMSDSTKTSGPASEVYYLNFNQDCTSLAVGTSKGYKLYSLTTVNSLGQIYQMNYKDVCIVERLFSSSLVAFVSLKCPRNLKVSHFRKGTEICNYSYSNSILAIKLNRARLIVCLEECLFIHNIRDMKVLHTIRDTPPNPSGLVTLAIPHELSFLAYPGSNTIGEVQIFDANNLHAKIMIPAHNSPLAALAFSPSGKEIATASEKGTVIRVFAIQDGSKLYEFRRGVKRCVSISSLVFSTDSNYLCCSSNTETVHIFKLDEAKETAQPGVEDNQGWIGYLAKAVSVSANYLPTQVTEVFNQGRAFASVHLPFQGVRTVCALTKTQRMLRLFVATADGYLYMYDLDPCEGGDGVLAKQFRIGVSDSSTPVEGSQPEEKAEPPPKETPTPAPNPESVSDYAGALKGRPPGPISVIGTEVIHEIALELESPSSGVTLRLHDDNEFPPVTQSADSKYHQTEAKKKARQEEAKMIYY